MAGDAVSDDMVEAGAKAFFAITHKPVGMDVDEAWARFADTIHDECRRIARAVLVGTMANRWAVAETATLRTELNEAMKRLTKREDGLKRIRSWYEATAEETGPSCSWDRAARREAIDVINAIDDALGITSNDQGKP
jgi:hypothetical protein